MISGTAVRFSDLGTVALPLPSTHEEVRSLVKGLHGARAGKHAGELGYVTADGSFVRPREAMVLARQSRQLKTGICKGEELLPWQLLPLKERGTTKAKEARLPATKQQLRDLYRKGLLAACGAVVLAAVSWGLLARPWLSIALDRTSLATGSPPWVTLLLLTLAGVVAVWAGASCVIARGSKYRPAALCLIGMFLFLSSAASMANATEAQALKAGVFASLAFAASAGTYLLLLVRLQAAAGFLPLALMITGLSLAGSGLF